MVGCQGRDAGNWACGQPLATMALRWAAAVYILLALLLAQHAAAQPAASKSDAAAAAAPHQAGSPYSPDRARNAMRSMMRAKLEGPDAVLSQGCKCDAEGRNWRQLAQKLSTPGAKINIVAFGGSVTQGRHPWDAGGSWVDEFVKWMQAAFPDVRFSTTNYGRDATDVTVAATCWYQQVPENTDLVLIEYSANGCSTTACLSIASPLVASYELLLRRLIRRVPDAAIMSLAIFSFQSFSVKSLGQDVPMPYYTGGTDMHTMLTRRYNVPMVSVRDAMYDLMYNDASMRTRFGSSRSKLMKDDIHPNSYGHTVYGRGLVAWAARQLLQRELQAIVDGGRRVDPPSLPRPVSPLAAREADGETFCVEGNSLKKYVMAKTVTDMSWSWEDGNPNKGYCNDFNCNRMGYIAEGFGKYLDIEIDTTQGPGRARSAKLDRQQLVIFFTRKSDGEKLGVARVSCEKGCKCAALELNGRQDTYFSELGSAATEVSAHPQCVVRVRILLEQGNGGDKFKVNGVAVVPFTGTPPLTNIDKDVLDKKAQR